MFLRRSVCPRTNGLRVKNTARDERWTRFGPMICGDRSNYPANTCRLIGEARETVAALIRGSRGSHAGSATDQRAATLQIFHLAASEGKGTGVYVARTTSARSRGNTRNVGARLRERMWSEHIFVMAWKSSSVHKPGTKALRATINIDQLICTTI